MTGLVGKGQGESLRLILMTPLSGSVGGAETVFQNLVCLLRQHGLHVCTVRNGSKRVAGKTALDYIFPLERIRTKKRIPYMSSFLAALVSAFRFFKVCLIVRPHIVNIHFVDTASVYAFFFRKLFRYRIVLTFHGSDMMCSGNEDGSLPDRFRRWALSGADRVTTVSKALADSASSLVPKMKHPPVFILNGIDLNFWKALSAERNPNRILSVGALLHVKGHDILLQALPTVISHCPDLQLFLAGAGRAQCHLEHLVKELELGQHVVFLGQCTSDEIRHHLSHASIFVMPSRREGLGLAVMEAMSAGVTTIASSVGGLPEIITHGVTGFLVRSKDPVALGEQISTCLGSPEMCRQIGLRGAQSMDAYSLEKMTMSYLKVYEDVLDNNVCLSCTREHVRHDNKR